MHLLRNPNISSSVQSALKEAPTVESVDTELFELILGRVVELSLQFTSYYELRTRIHSLRMKIMPIRDLLQELLEVLDGAETEYSHLKNMYNLEKERCEELETMNQMSISNLRAMKDRIRVMKHLVKHMEKRTSRLTSQFNVQQFVLQHSIEERISLSIAIKRARADIQALLKGPHLFRLVQRYHLDTVRPLEFNRRSFRISRREHYGLAREGKMSCALRQRYNIM